MSRPVNGGQDSEQPPKLGSQLGQQMLGLPDRRRWASWPKNSAPAWASLGSALAALGYSVTTEPLTSTGRPLASKRLRPLQFGYPEARRPDWTATVPNADRFSGTFLETYNQRLRKSVLQTPGPWRGKMGIQATWFCVGTRPGIPKGCLISFYTYFSLRIPFYMFVSINAFL